MSTRPDRTSECVFHDPGEHWSGWRSTIQESMEIDDFPREQAAEKAATGQDRRSRKERGAPRGGYQYPARPRVVTDWWGTYT
jgi:hypothetical protein